MTIKRVQRAAEIRGIYFYENKKFLNSTVGVGYEILKPDGRGCFQTGNLNSLYREIKKYPVIKKGANKWLQLELTEILETLIRKLK